MFHEAYILLVEDDVPTREAIRDVLSDAGFRVCEVDDGTTALAQLSCGGPLPALILLDLMMPRMDGRTFRHLQRQLPRLSCIPTVLITALPWNLLPRDDSAVVGVLAKPISAEALLDVARIYCT